MPVPTWQAANPGLVSQAGQANQFLGAHGSTWLYGGSLQSSQAIGSTNYVSSNGENLAQVITTGAAQTTIGQVWLQLSAVGGSPVTATITPAVLSLYADSFGLPSGTALASVSLNEQAVYSAPFWVPFPLAASGLAPSTQYFLVLSPAGGSSAYYAWQRSNQAAGASTSPDGVTWTTQGYGLMYQVYDQGAGGRLQFLNDDGGARWTQLTYDAQGRVSAVTEYCAAQGGTAAFTSTRTLAYTGTVLTGVS